MTDTTTYPRPLPRLAGGHESNTIEQPCYRCGRTVAPFGGLICLLWQADGGGAIVLHMSCSKLDQRNIDIMERRAASLWLNQQSQVGDFVIFADGVQRRISHVWDWDDGNPAHIQTSEGGSFYMGEGYVSFSGSLHPGVPGDTFTLTDEVRDGGVWFFSHDHHTAHNGVDVTVPFRVWRCSEIAPR